VLIGNTSHPKRAAGTRLRVGRDWREIDPFHGEAMDPLTDHSP
jgi:hypothetical protein